MSPRLSTLISFLALGLRLFAQTEETTRYLLHAAVYCQASKEPLKGMLIQVINEQGHIDSLFTDTLGVALTSVGEDSLWLRNGSEFKIEVRWPGTDVLLRDQVITMSFSGSTTFLKEYFVRNCTDPSIDRWRPPSIYFPKSSVIPRNDSEWYLQEAHVNSLEFALDVIVQTMEDNPTAILMAVGYCDGREKDCATLSLDRARRVKDMLIEKGAPSERLWAEGRGISYEHSATAIARMKDRHEREEYLARERQVTFSVVGFTDNP